ncbi:MULTISPECIES: hypothetical protein [Bradyrhizobium]|uniref:hypothetical protein n=1 Tax=Bradyrhizobium TaxID=374 RepID=UPI0013015D4E|nr:MULTISPECIES: hypothetical protein [Bradyrhizobium]MCP1833868.1 hypothetical protein [Bradyrhizobium sp. USDA 4545]MCP1852896.1 hypothetical protein [Bradyrhizobium sp. USDA 4541]MCP1918613.1 hypothetical protein [Bradyrhizobium sp. USDA 4532]
MIKTLVVVVQVTWTVSVVGMATVIGVLGFGCHGWIGAIGFGTAGFGVGAVLAA